MHKVCDVYQTEMDNSNKLIALMSEGLYQYYQLLQGHGHMTNDMADCYRNVVRMAQGIRSVTFKNEDVSVTSQDSNITVKSLETLCNCKFLLYCIFKLGL